MKIALVHDYFLYHGGGEQVFYEIYKLLKDKYGDENIDIFTAYVNDKFKFPEFLNHKGINRSFLDRLPIFKRFLNNRLVKLIWVNLLPTAFSSFKFDGYNLIVSDTQSFARNVVCPPNCRHINYVHTPARFLWGLESTEFSSKSLLFKMVYNFLFGNKLRLIDYTSTQRTHLLIANSEETLNRIRKFYKREAYIVNPPVDIARINEFLAINAPLKVRFESQDYYVFIGRLEPYKNIAKLLEIWPNDRNIVLIGKGTLGKELERKYKKSSNIEFLGFVPDIEKFTVLKSAKALINPNREDFGITNVEALACGTPVISFNVGGAKEIVKHKEMGYLMSSLNTKRLIKSLKYIESRSFNKQNLMERAKQYDISVFRSKWYNILEVMTQ